jgi:hypothetical protein
VAQPALVALARRAQQESKVFFSEEKKQKTFANSGVSAAGEDRDSTRKSLLVLFIRKERLPFFVPPRPPSHQKTNIFLAPSPKIDHPLLSAPPARHFPHGALKFRHRHEPAIQAS